VLEEILGDPRSIPRIVHVERIPAREARYGTPREPFSAPVARLLREMGIQRLWSHQAAALDALARGSNVVIATGTASGKSLCYQIAAIDAIARDADAKALWLFPTKALAQDQLRASLDAFCAAGIPEAICGCYDGDTPPNQRRRLRDGASVILTNPDMLHAGIMSRHPQWAHFFEKLRYIVLDEIHTYTGLFGSNVANLFRRLDRVLEHYGAHPRFVCSSATIRNPRELAECLVGRSVVLVDDDGSPQGERTYVFWNPPQVRSTIRRSRASANVEAHQLMARLVRNGLGTITFSKAWVTAELIYRYVAAELAKTDPAMAEKVTPYRGGFLPAERREIERRLFSGELKGVSATRALELGIDAGALDACVVVGYPGTLASFFQQAGRAGRRGDSAVFLVGLDTAINQYVMCHPAYVFGRPVENAVVEPDNPYIVTGHLRCAASELPLADGELRAFGPLAAVAVEVLEDHHKLTRIGRK